LWKVPLLPGQDKARLDQNQSSPIVWGDRVFVTLSYWPAGVEQKQYPEHHVLCFNKSDGARLWDSIVPHGPWLLTDLRGGYSAPTPATDGQNIFVVFGSAVIAALDLDGKILWHKEIAPHSFDVAMGSSPLLYEDKVLLLSDQTNGESRLVAHDKKTGAVRWEQKRPDMQWAHSTPVLVEVKGKPQLLVSAHDAVQGLDPANGKPIWWCKGSGKDASPAFAAGLVYCDGGRAGVGVAVDPTGAGDVSKTHIKWTVPQVPEGLSSPIIVGDHVYRLHDPGVLRCWKLATGAEVYAERLPGVSTRANPIATPDGRIYFASAGKSFVIKAGPRFEILATSDLGDASSASAAVSDGRLILKGSRFLFCVGLAVKAP